MIRAIQKIVVWTYKQKFSRSVIEKAAAHFPARTNKLINEFLTTRPRTFNEHIRYRMVRSSGQLEIIFADKLSSKTHINSLLGRQNLTPTTLKIFSNATQMSAFDFPSEFVLKANHYSGGSVICWKGAPRNVKWSDSPFSRNMLNPNDLSPELLVNFFQGVLRTTSKRFVFPEVPYENAKPAIILEELFQDEINGALPSDLKLFMFNGELKLIRFHTLESKESLSKNIDEFDSDWRHLPNQFYEPSKVFTNAHIRPQMPGFFPEILEVAKTLSSGIDFVRVDFLLTSQGYRVGELTSFPTAGLGRWKKGKIDHELGSLFR